MRNPIAQQTVNLQTLTVPDQEGDQRIDNYLFRYFRNIPKSLLYRLMRCGSIKVNRKRVKPTYRVAAYDTIYLPRFTEAKTGQKILPPQKRTLTLDKHIVYEDQSILVLDKPAGLAVHGGSGLAYGLIELLRASRPDGAYFELVHRLDRETSGLILIAKKRSSLRALHEQLRTRQVQKEYLAVVSGQWDATIREIKVPLLKKQLNGGGRFVVVSPDGKVAETQFRVQEPFGAYATLLKIRPHTGRTHQIRVHTQHAGCPILGDDRYGKRLQPYQTFPSVSRLYLHAQKLRFLHPCTKHPMQLEACTDKAWEEMTAQLRALATV